MAPSCEETVKSKLDLDQQSIDSSNSRDDVFAAVDRQNIPDDESKTQPWRDLDIGFTSEWEPSRWNIPGQAYKRLVVTVTEYFTFMSGGT